MDKLTNLIDLGRLKRIAEDIQRVGDALDARDVLGFGDPLADALRDAAHELRTEINIVSTRAAA